MSTSKFHDMSDEEVNGFRPRSEAEEVAREAESLFREWCKENEEDPLDENARQSYGEMQEESGDKFWDGLSQDDRAGWEDNMNKD